MTNEEKLVHVREYYLADAIKSIETYRRYWNSSIPRMHTNTLVQELISLGYGVISYEIAPQWEHVFYLSEDASSNNNNELKVIAEKRYLLMNNGVKESELPI